MPVIVTFRGEASRSMVEMVASDRAGKGAIRHCAPTGLLSDWRGACRAAGGATKRLIGRVGWAGA